MWEDGLVVNKDGSMQKTFRFRGNDLDSATQGELLNVVAQVNNALKRLTEGWVIYVDAIRKKNNYYPKSDFPDPLSFMIDEERRKLFKSGVHYESDYFFTIMWLPPEDNAEKISSFVLSKKKLEKGIKKQREIYTNHVQTFKNETTRIFNLFTNVFPEAKMLDSDETLTYLHSTVSTKNHKIVTPETPMYLDEMLCDCPLVAEFKPKLGNQHLRVISLRSFPGISKPGLMDALNRLNIEYRWTTRFMPINKATAVSEGNSLSKKWFAKRQSFFSMISAMATGRESVIVDANAVNNSNECQDFVELINGDYVNSGYFTMTITVMDEIEENVNKKILAIEKVINNLGFVSINEELNALEAWLGSIPCQPRFNVIRPLLTSITTAHLMPLSATWAGDEINKHLNAPPLMYTPTTGSTKFRFNLHVDDVGHTMIVGPTSSGKSVLLGIIAAQFRRYKNAQVYFFDKDASCRILTYGVGGDFYDLGSEDNSLSFQPLANIDNMNELNWAESWILDILRAENVTITPEYKSLIREALISLASNPIEQRTITGFKMLVQSEIIREAIKDYTQAGSFGEIFDAPCDTLKYGTWQVFEMAKLMEMKAAVPPTLSYLFHKLDQRFQNGEGNPTVLILDECWLFFDNPVFAERIREWLKVLRKANVSVIFATQSLQDIDKSPIAPTIMDNCHTKIFLPNPNARDSHFIEQYQKFGLNEKEISIIANATPKREYYYKSKNGSRKFELDLGKLTLAYVASNNQPDQKFAKSIVAEHGLKHFNEHWLIYKGLEKQTEEYKKIIHAKHNKENYV
jgi:type IV secretion system protein VirB4